MLDGLEASELSLSKILSGAATLRFDSEYYQKQFIADENKILARPEEFERPDDLGLAVDGSAFYPALEPYYEQGDLPFLRVADVRGVVDYDSCVHIPENILPNFPTLKLVDIGDILLTKGGSIARAGLVTQRAAVSRDLIFINSSKLAEPDYVYLSLYFQTDFCYRLLIRSSSMSVQPHLTLTLVKELDIYKASDAFKDAILRIYTSAYQKLEQSKVLYAEAESLLLAELGLKDWQPPNDLAYERKASEVFASGRLDSQFFHPQYEWLANSLKRLFPAQSIGGWGKVLKGMSVDYTADDNGVPVIRSGDLSDIEDEQKFLKASPNQGMFLLKNGDVLISSIGFGSIGKIQVFDKQDKYATVSEVTVIRQKQVNPYYLHFFLACPAGQLQINHYITGATGQLHLYPKDVERILVPIVSQELELKLENHFKTSRQLKQQAHNQLEIAKRGVEMAIEQDEGTALAWMSAQD